jgi:aspartyl-tRNA(Asn)/glutamyl-tRNA(Gln) amidotransferase subunit C
MMRTAACVLDAAVFLRYPSSFHRMANLMTQADSSRKPAAASIDVRYVANLARLDLTDEEVATFQPQLDQIVRYVDEISGLDVEGVEPTAHAIAITNVFRDDAVTPGMERERLLANAPEQCEDLIRVPKIVE